MICRTNLSCTKKPIFITKSSLHFDHKSPPAYAAGFFIRRHPWRSPCRANAARCSKKLQAFLYSTPSMELTLSGQRCALFKKAPDLFVLDTIHGAHPIVATLCVVQKGSRPFCICSSPLRFVIVDCINTAETNQ